MAQIQIKEGEFTSTIYGMVNPTSIYSIFVLLLLLLKFPNEKWWVGYFYPGTC